MIHPTPRSGPACARLRIGLLGGSFNPAHEGHMAISLYGLKRLGLDQVWWLVSPQNPLKARKGMAPFGERLARARLLARRHARIRATDIERQLGTVCTIDTLEALRRRFPRARFVWLMGADNLANVHRWRRWEAVFATVPIAVFRRPGYAVKSCRSKAAVRFAAARRKTEAAALLAAAPPPAWVALDNPLSKLSATAIRQKTTPRKGR
jgi:nicotinate-nucleotide adenylyltransferase